MHIKYLILCIVYNFVDKSQSQADSLEPSSSTNPANSNSSDPPDNFPYNICQADITACELISECSIEDRCTEFCAVKDANESSLTIFSNDCGKKMFMQAQLKTKKMVTLFINHYGSLTDSDRLIFGSNEVLIWMQDWRLFGRSYDVELPERVVKSIKIIVGYDSCDKNLYFIDLNNHLKIAPSAGPEIFLNVTFKYSVEAACIDFFDKNIYVISRTSDRNICVAKRSKLSEFNFQNLFTFSSDYSIESIRKANRENRIFISYGNTILLYNDDLRNITLFDFGSEVKSFDVDSEFIYATCNDWRNIRKLNYKNPSILENVTDDLFENAPMISLTKIELCPQVQSGSKIYENSSQWIPWVAAFGGLVFLLVTIILVMFVCIRRRNSSNRPRLESPSLPPGFKTIQFSDNIYDENPYTEIETFEFTPTMKRKISEEPTTPESTYIYAIEPNKFDIAPEIAMETETNIYSNKTLNDVDDDDQVKAVT